MVREFRGTTDEEHELFIALGMEVLGLPDTPSIAKELSFMLLACMYFAIYLPKLGVFVAGCTSGIVVLSVLNRRKFEQKELSLHLEKLRTRRKLRELSSIPPSRLIGPGGDAYPLPGGSLRLLTTTEGDLWEKPLGHKDRWVVVRSGKAIIVSFSGFIT